MRHIRVEIPKLSYPQEEAYKTLRTNLLFCGNEKKVINITSCRKGEGKSTVSLLLAHSLSESGKKTLLLDADMRQSVLFKKIRDFKHGEVRGLSHLLSGQAELEDVLFEVSDVPNMYVVFSGTFPPNPAELLGNSKMKSAIEEFRNCFDYIIIDTPPLGMVIDSAIVAADCDGSVLVIESDSVNAEFARDVMDQLTRTGCPFLGVVLNKDYERNDYYGKKYYADYYKKGGKEEDQ